MLFPVLGFQNKTQDFDLLLTRLLSWQKIRQCPLGYVGGYLTLFIPLYLNTLNFKCGSSLVFCLFTQLQICFCSIINCNCNNNWISLNLIWTVFMPHVFSVIDQPSPLPVSFCLTWSDQVFSSFLFCCGSSPWRQVWVSVWVHVFSDVIVRTLWLLLG